LVGGTFPSDPANVQRAQNLRQTPKHRACLVGLVKAKHFVVPVGYFPTSEVSVSPTVRAVAPPYKVEQHERERKGCTDNGDGVSQVPVVDQVLKPHVDYLLSNILFLLAAYLLGGTPGHRYSRVR
jgi:hypothetical protein